MNIWYRRISSLVIIYMIQRILFFGFNFQALETIDSSTIALAFADGLRFDACMIATINAPIMVIHLMRGLQLTSSFSRWTDQIVNILFCLSNLPLIVFGIVDSKLFSFTGRRITPEIFSIANDIQAQSVGIMLQFWWITLPSVVLMLWFIWWNWQTDHSVRAYSPAILKRYIPVTIIGLSSAFLLIRGGWQTKPLAPAHAYHWQPVPLANMVLNSSMTLLRTPESSSIRRYQDVSSDEELRDILHPNLQHKQPSTIAKGKNVVILIVESLATEYVGFLNQGRGFTPFIDSLAKTSIVFEDSFASGRRSIDAMPAIFAGIPAWRDQPFVTSPYASNEIEPLPRALGELGYKTMFFHGASNGSMHFDVFASLSGFDDYIGLNEYPTQPGDHDGQWGIFDEPFLQYAVERLSTVTTPFFCGIFTLTSHNPFKIPEKYNNRFPKGTLPIHEAIGYADYAVAQFFKSASSKPWFKNTIFIITGDHTSLSDNSAYDHVVGRFRVPIIFHDPSGTLPLDQAGKIATHIDLKPTIMDLLGVESSKFGLFGGPLFRDDWQGRFIQSNADRWYYRDNLVQVTLDTDEQASAYDLRDTNLGQPKHLSPEQLKQVRLLKAARQYFYNGLLDNSWYQKKTNGSVE